MSTALVAGAGIGGLAAALALANIGHQVIVVERAPQIEEVGAGIQISPNATRVLSKFGLLDSALAVASQPESLAVRRGRDGGLLSRMPLGQRAAALWGSPSLTIHRADLQGILLAAARSDPNIEVRTNHELSGFALDDGAIVAALRYGLARFTARADLLIGADGLHSVVRDKLNVPGAPRYTGQHAWRALIPMNDVPRLLRRNETALWLGHRTHLVNYPLRGGSVMNVVAIVEAGRNDKIGNGWSEIADPRRLHAAFSVWCDEAQSLLKAAQNWRCWQLFDRDPCPRWGDGPVTLLGDAAHPMLPFLAQGASQALEDADVLARHLAGAADIAQAMRAYENERAPRTSRIQLEARRQAKIYHLSGPAAFARDMGMKMLGPQRLQQRYDWLYSA